MEYKTTTKLFKGTYQYKIVLICATAAIFRSSDMDSTLAQLQKIEIGKPNTDMYSVYRLRNSIKTQEELDYAFAIHSQLVVMKDMEVRVETPWITVYSNSIQDINTLASLNEKFVKYICTPPANTLLEEGTIIMPKMNYEFRVTVGKTTSEHSAFIQWAEGNTNLKLTKSCKKELLRSRSWGGSHFYITGANALLMAKMHLGGCIAKVERIIKA